MSCNPRRRGGPFDTPQAYPVLSPSKDQGERLRRTDPRKPFAWASRLRQFDLQKPFAVRSRTASRKPRTVMSGNARRRGGPFDPPQAYPVLSPSKDQGERVEAD